MRRNNPRHQHKLGADLLQNSFAEEEVGVLVDKKLNISR